eukprot:1142830-Pelagomonas_calceolata.AAC.1
MRATVRGVDEGGLQLWCAHQLSYFSSPRASMYGVHQPGGSRFRSWAGAHLGPFWWELMGGSVLNALHWVARRRTLGLDIHAATRLALKIHGHSVQYAYKLVSIKRTLEKTSLNSHRQDQARATASNPPDPH